MEIESFSSEPTSSVHSLAEILRTVPGQNFTDDELVSIADVIFPVVAEALAVGAIEEIQFGKFLFTVMKTYCKFGVKDTTHAVVPKIAQLFF